MPSMSVCLVVAVTQCSSLVMVGTRGRFYPLASSHTHTGLLDTVNTKLDGAFSFVIYDIL